jgi:DNA-binding XRE family transcriptional regulator
MNLQKIRLERGYTIKELSTIADVPIRTIEAIEKREREGKPSCKTETAIKLSNALKVSLEELIR